MYRTHTCGALRTTKINQKVTLAGWIHKIRDKGVMIWVDLRDHYGITQLKFEEEHTDPELISMIRSMGREYVIKVEGKVIERVSKNPDLPTGDIEIDVTDLKILNQSKTPPFTVDPVTDGGEELRMKYRYIDLRRAPMQKNLKLRYNLTKHIRNYLGEQGFVEIETPVLIKSTPEGARDFVVPSRLNPGEFYALPQSPQTFKQLLMISGFDKYFQIVKCFRDEDLRADRQPEFTQIDCEMSFVNRDDVLNTFEGLVKFIFKQEAGVELEDFPIMSYDEAIRLYGTDKPDLRFPMTFIELNHLLQGKGFQVFDSAEYIVGFTAPGSAGFSRKQLDELTEFVKRPQIGAKGLVYIKHNSDGSVTSSIDKFYPEDDLRKVCDFCEAREGDMVLILAGPASETRTALSELRLEMGDRLKMRKPNLFKPLWVLDFPLLEWDEDSQRYFAMHHPFTSPVEEDLEQLKSNPGGVKANAYDMVINGVELGGGSIRIHNREFQKEMFGILGLSEQEAEAQFGYLMNALEYGAPPHGGIAFGFDRLCALLGGSDSIRDFIAFPKNNAGKDLMINTPSPLNPDQLDELHLSIL